ncbi:peroxisome biogenesis protein 2 [Dorcoceras hygrometricum]|uniref:Peroxisome biogenesis protein 2 n=1 Tax=Dorcoceras hygrometricum TaxID=472368 RepID=A0A2Z7CPT3_9LAMI|nr:peroxisome biogenesis protein 2 [Dorcoceras hygrometricum]
MSLFDLQDVCIAIGSIATLDLPMVVDLIGIYGLKGPYYTLTTTDWFLQALSVIPRGSWGDVARRFTMIRWAMLLVQPDEGVSDLVVDRICDNLPQSTEKSRILVIPVGARHKCQQAGGRIRIPNTNEIEKASFFSGYTEPNQAIMDPNNISHP